MIIIPAKDQTPINTAEAFVTTVLLSTGHKRERKEMEFSS